MIGVPQKYWCFNLPIEKVDLAATSEIQLATLKLKTKAYIIFPQMAIEIDKLIKVVANGPNLNHTPIPNETKKISLE